MSAELNEEDEGPVDRVNVVSNLLMLRLEEFIGQPVTDNTMMACAMSIKQSLMTMQMVFRVTNPIPDVRVTREGEHGLHLMLLDETKQPMTIREWLYGKE